MATKQTLRTSPKATKAGEMAAEKLQKRGVKFARRYMSLLAGAGYQCIGTGCFATAWAHPEKPAEVVKVATGTDTYRDGYLPFLHWAIAKRADKACKFRKVLPRIDSAYVTAGFFAVRMERLNPQLGQFRVRGPAVAANPERWPLLAMARDELVQLADTSGYDLDMHGGNIMRRGKRGALVVTDPLGFPHWKATVAA